MAYERQWILRTVKSLVCIARFGYLNRDENGFDCRSTFFYPCIFFSPFRSFREIKNKFSSCSANWFLYFENSNFECYYCSILFTDYFFKLWNKFSKLMQWIQITFAKKRKKIYIAEHIYNWTRIFNNIIYLTALVIHISVQYVYIYVAFGRY